LLLLNLLKNDALIKGMPERIKKSVNTDKLNISKYKELDRCAKYLMKTYTPKELWGKSSKREVSTTEINSNL